jgi:hypothetical protein
VPDRRNRTVQPGSRLFAVRVWTEAVDGGGEYRGCVRDVITGAFRGFREWSDLVAFLIGRMEEDECAQTRGAEGETEWPLERR